LIRLAGNIEEFKYAIRKFDLIISDDFNVRLFKRNSNVVHGYIERVDGLKSEILLNLDSAV